MNAIIVYDSLSTIGGGSQIVALTLFHNYKKLGIPVKLLTTKKILSLDPNISADDVFFCPEVKLEYLYPFSIALPFFSRTLQKQLLDFKPDIIHVHEPTLVSLAISSLAKKHHIRIVSSYHTRHDQIRISSWPLSLIFNNFGIMNWIENSLQNKIMNQSDVITVPTQNMKSLLSASKQKKAVIIPPPVSAGFFTHKKRKRLKPTRLIVVARIEKQKRLEELLRIMTLLKGRYTLSIYGDGPDRTIIEDLLTQLSLTDIVQLHGWVSQEQLASLLPTYDLFISMSNFETFGLTKIEALARGIPCVLYDYPTTQEIIPKGMAILINSFEVKEWANTLIHLQENDDYHSMLDSIEKNYSMLEGYKEEAIAHRFLDVYTKLLTQPHVKH